MSLAQYLAPRSGFPRRLSGWCSGWSRGNGDSQNSKSEEAIKCLLKLLSFSILSVYLRLLSRYLHERLGERSRGLRYRKVNSLPGWAAGNFQMNEIRGNLGILREPWCLIGWTFFPLYEVCKTILSWYLCSLNVSDVLPEERINRNPNKMFFISVISSVIRKFQIGKRDFKDIYYQFRRIPIVSTITTKRKEKHI